MNNEFNYLFNERPLVIRPELARIVGLNESIFLQQLNYWLIKSNHLIDGKKWIYNTYNTWHDQFPFWSVSTIKRLITHLENKKLILIVKYNKAGFDKTNWYTINYPELQKSVNQRLVQNDPTSGSNCTNGLGQDEPTNTIDYTETTSETNKNHKSSSKTEHDHSAAKEVIAYLNERTGKHYRNTSSNYRMIEPRLKDYSVDDLKHVVDVKCSQWINDSKMNKFLRPATLFQASKIDGYLNEQPKKEIGGGSYNDLDF
ncbi:conserved phage C-terminal domain-containing protein (plasmid) [Apilactobacillus apisilvae]|uniref:Conserved phage C-terminal domain-containing protein n=1 Tax=Apilactobacillus apisilvae TaxID=2923364 RepID=A0ABY4PK38_9LACO|nr:conserved phage C-terminal domain-containing protein [Apilactobacillus apisilvae]UQS85817.1 conserved phage C-terminal domain-containing protein [Apilactobacillus apisilvae]